MTEDDYLVNFFDRILTYSGLNQFTVDDGDGAEDEMVSPAPSLTFHLTSKNDAESNTTLHCDLTLSPVELLYRHNTVSNLVKLMKQLDTLNEDSDSNIKSIAQYFTKLLR